MLNEVISNLNLKKDGLYVDATVGYAGHSREILKRIKKGFLFAFDQDLKAITYSKHQLAKIGSNFELINTNFINLKKELEKRKITSIDGILFDLGVSSPQLDDKERGFSFHQDALLDMRMDLNNKLSAYQVVNEYPYQKLANILFSYGQEKYAKRIAKEIVNYRMNKKIKTTLELVKIISQAVPAKYKRIKHPARKTFQAIRIEVNDELITLEKALEDAISLLKVDGQIVVITFHSLEARICKQVFKKYSTVPLILKRLPTKEDTYQPILKIIGRYKPSEVELNQNKRARSAYLLVAKRI